MDAQAVETLINNAGFESQGSLNPSGLKTLSEVRDMCAADKCQHYDKNWSCPPACGTIEDYEEEMHAFDQGRIIQTVVELEDSMDWEGIYEAMEIHQDRVHKLANELSEFKESYMLLAAGACTLCPECTFPDEPCTLPDRRLVSMEAAGLNVTETCKLANVPYNHGPNTLAYTSCLLFND